MVDAKILVIDDNKSVLSALEILLQFEYDNIITISNPNQISSFPNLAKIDVVLLDMNFSAGVNSGNEGLFWLKEIKKKSPLTAVIMMTAYGDVELAVRALKEGASDFILKPWNNEKFLATVKAAYMLRKSQKEINQLKQKESNLKQVINQDKTFIIGNSKSLTSVLDLTQKVAKTDVNVLITGENGTGKELIARQLHRLSPRQNEVFIAVDMGSISENLFESELFGHLKGAFTDAKEDRIGKFEAANGGTLFLDEIGNLSFQMQAKLLSAIQNKVIVRVGSNKVIPVDIRLVCATNGNLEQMVIDGLFREDLLYRINTIQIEVPALRDRGDDILILADFYLNKYSAKYAKHGIRINDIAEEKLKQYSWPGNVRELQHTLERAVILCEGNILKPTDFILNAKSLPSTEPGPKTLEEMEEIMILEALHNNEGNYSAAAAQLGISRQTLYNKIKKQEKMVSKNFYFQTIGRVVFISATAILIAYLLFKESYVLTALTSFVLVLQTYQLIRYVNETNRKIAYFFDAIKNEDFTLRFPEKLSVKSLKELNHSLNMLNEMIQKIHLKNQTQERFYQEILKQADIGILAINNKGHILFANPRLEHMLNYTPLNHIKQLSQVDENLYHIFSELKPFERRMFQLTNEREKVDLAIKSSSFNLDGQELLLVVIQDIHQELDEKETESWTKLIRVLTHEIMNSITPITSISDSILKYHTTENKNLVDGTEYQKRLDNTIKGLEVIKDQGTNLMSFVQSYRSFLNVPLPDKKIVPVQNLLDKVILLVGQDLENSNTSIEMQMDTQDLELFIDEKQITQVLINLCRNALQSLEQQKDSSIKLKGGTNGSGQKYIEVEDNGPGIPADLINEIFVPFFTTKNIGTGVGLSLSKQILRMHGGNLKVSSQPDRYTTFTLLF